MLLICIKGVRAIILPTIVKVLEKDFSKIKNQKDENSKIKLTGQYFKILNSMLNTIQEIIQMRGYLVFFKKKFNNSFYRMIKQ